MKQLASSVKLFFTRNVLFTEDTLPLCLKALTAFFLLALCPIEATASEVKPQFIVAHITDTRPDYNLTMCHVGHKARGWDSCGYNWLIYRDGKIVESRGHKVGAHAKGYNSISYGIGLVGKNSVTEAQLSAFQNLVNQLGDLPIKPHNELNKKKTCPTHEVWEQIKQQREGRVEHGKSMVRHSHR